MRDKDVRKRSFHVVAFFNRDQSRIRVRHDRGTLSVKRTATPRRQGIIDNIGSTFEKLRLISMCWGRGIVTFLTHRNPNHILKRDFLCQIWLKRRLKLNTEYGQSKMCNMCALLWEWSAVIHGQTV